MKLSFKIFALIMALCLLLSACGSPAESAPADTPAPTAAPESGPAPEKADIPQDNLGYALGKTLPDFSFQTYDGREMSLYAALAEKELVVINIWATWCGPCGMEFPYMEEAYQQYKDSVEIFALSCESSDSDEKLAEYVAEMGMSFPVGRDTNNLAAAFNAYSIPTTVLVDRYGTISTIEVGAKTSTEAFTSLFEQYIGDDYVPGQVNPGEAELPVCDVEPSSEEALAAALNADGGSIVFHNVDSEHIWPFLVTENGPSDAAVAVSSNAGIDSSVAGIVADINAEAGDVLRVDFALSAEEGSDLMCIYLDGALVKSFGGQRNYMSYAFTIEEAGEHQVIISYSKDSYGSGGEDCLRLYGLSQLSGAEGEEALRANPVYIWGESTSLKVTNPGAKEVILHDPQQALISSDAGELFSFWVVSDTEVQLLLSLAEGEDPEKLLFFSDYDGSFATALSGASQDGYGFASAVDSLDTSGYAYTSVYVQDIATPALFRSAICFPDEANLESFLSQLVDSQGNRLVSWAYADGSEKQTPGDAVYSVSFTDQNGDAVSGVMLQVCNDSTCRVFTSDKHGLCSFALPPYAYEMHILSLPEGYEGDTESITIAPLNGGELEFKLTKK